MAQVGVVAKIVAKEGQRDELVGALQAALDAAQGEEGTRYYLLHTDAQQADVLWMYELYESQEALQAHMGSEAFKAIGPAVGNLVAARPELTFMTPVGGKGL
jgi:quinol monooxygenase YgiN